MHISMKIAKEDPAIVEIARGGLHPVHHVLHRSDMKKVGLIACGSFVALTALGIFSHYKIHQAIANRKLQKKLAPVTAELEALRAENETLRQQLAAKPAAEAANQEA